MAIKLQETKITFFCPYCKKVIKTKTDSDALWLVYVLLFPIGLIVLIINIIKYLCMQKTSTGDEILSCPHCNKQVIIANYGTRPFVSAQEILNKIQPFLNKISNDFNLFVGQYDKEKANKTDELLILFKNRITEKECKVGFKYIDKLKINFNNQNYDFSEEKLLSIVAELN